MYAVTKTFLKMPPAGSEDERTIFVGGLNPYQPPDQDHLFHLLEEAGPVESLNMIYNEETQKFLGYAFCVYADRKSAVAAVRTLNGRIYDQYGRSMRVDFVYAK